MPSVIDHIDLVRKRFNVSRRGKTFLALEAEKEVDVSRVLLSHFASGGRIGIESIVKVETWCERQERERGEQ